MTTTNNPGSNDVPGVCPLCGSVHIVKIIYGEATHETGEAAARGECVLGGCMIFEEAPRFHCKACGHDWGRLDETEWFDGT